ncbi:MAG: erythromycin esterase family protein, partial [Acidobacteria bacterium]|nr:erythromycin esterase family protein [Acidobacteriota bacterium]
MFRIVFAGFARQMLILGLIFSANTFGFAQKKQNKAQEVKLDPDAAVVSLIREAVHPLTNSERDYDPLMEIIGDARFVMLGEATHGTHEFYRERARITRRLIEEKGFNAVVIEADWTDAYRVNRFVRGEGIDKNAERALSGFERFPQWMWRNKDFRDFVNSIRSYNESRSAGTNKVGIFGMDLYGLTESIDAVVNYLKTVEPEAARRARKRYGCFARFRENPQLYGYEINSGTARS